MSDGFRDNLGGRLFAVAAAVAIVIFVFYYVGRDDPPSADPPRPAPAPAPPAPRPAPPPPAAANRCQAAIARMETAQVAADDTVHLAEALMLADDVDDETFQTAYTAVLAAVLKAEVAAYDAAEVCPEDRSTILRWAALLVDMRNEMIDACVRERPYLAAADCHEDTR